MEEVQNKGADPDEIQQETELLKETPADEVRTSIIEKFGLNEDVDGELIEKLLENEIESGKKLSTAIKQKIGWRTKATARTEQKPEQKPEEKPQVQPKAEDIDKILDQKLEERELNSLDISDELKQQIKTYAKAGGLTVKQVLQSDFYKFLKDKEEAKQKVEEASIGGKRRAPSRREFDANNPPKPDMSTEEGRKEWDDYLTWLKTQ